MSKGSKESMVRDPSGKVTHVRVTTEGGSRSTLYQANQGLDILVSGAKGPAVEQAEHHPGGKTTAYEADNSLIGVLFHGGKGAKKG